MNEFTHHRQDFFIPRVRTSGDRVKVLVVDIYQIGGHYAYVDWRELINDFARQWLARHPHQRPATLWCSRAYSSLFNGGDCWHGACSSNLPEAFLMELAAFLANALEGHVKIGEEVIVNKEEGWRPYLHFEAGKVWDEDEIERGGSVDLGPCDASMSRVGIESDSNGSIIYADLAGRSFLENLQRANTAEFEEALKSRDNGEIEHYVTRHADKLSNPDLFLHGDTPLHMAALAGHTDACRQLLERVDPAIRNAAQRTALIHLAKYRRHESYGRVIEMLSSTIDAADGAGRTALMYAALGTVGLRGNTRLVKALARNGADLACPDNEGQTALKLAMRDNRGGGNSAVVELLKRFTIEHAALQCFNAQYHYGFNWEGDFTFSSR